MCKSFLRRTCHQAVSTLQEIKSSGAEPRSEISIAHHQCIAPPHSPAHLQTHSRFHFNCQAFNSAAHIRNSNPCQHAIVYDKDTHCRAPGIYCNYPTYHEVHMYLYQDSLSRCEHVCQHLLRSNHHKTWWGFHVQQLQFQGLFMIHQLITFLKALHGLAPNTSWYFGHKCSFFGGLCASVQLS